MSARRSRPSLLALAASALVLHASVANAAQAILDECAAYGCGANGGSGAAGGASAIPGTTLIDSPPGQSPAGFPGATAIGTGQGKDGQPVVTWKVENPTTIAIPSCAPTEPPGGKWTITTKDVTHVVGGETLIFREPGLAVITPPPPVPVTVTSTERLTETTTKTETETKTNFVTETTTSISTLPPVTSTSYVHLTETETVYRTETQWSTVTSVSLSTLTETSTSTWISTSYVPVTETRWSTTTLTTTSIPPAQTAFVTTTSTSYVQLPPVTTTATTTTSVSYCPEPSRPPCSAAFKQTWTNTDVYVNNPFTLQYDDPYPSYLRIQDAGYKTETYTIRVDGAYLGTTSNINVDGGIWCQIVDAPTNRHTCDSMGMSKGEFVIPSGKHTVTIHHNNDAGSGQYSTLFYAIERKCSETKEPLPYCYESEVQGWRAFDVYEGGQRTVQSTNYAYPVKVTIVDAGYRAEMYDVHVDGQRVGQTHRYETNLGIWCGITADKAQNCLNQGHSSGTYVIPAGSHTLSLINYSTRNPSWAAYSTVFYRFDRFCPSS